MVAHSDPRRSLTSRSIPGDPRSARRLPSVLLLAWLIAAFLANPGPAKGEAPAPSRSRDTPPSAGSKVLGLPRNTDYLHVKKRARAWFDQLRVDPVELERHRVKGIKKLAEILDAYLLFYTYAKDPAERAAILDRVRSITLPTRTPGYHDLLLSSDRTLVENGTSYLRVLWQLDQFGLDTTYYRKRLAEAKPQLDGHLDRRGVWQRAMFAKYYDALGLDKPPVLTRAETMKGVIAARLPVEQYTKNHTYELTHEVFAAYDYGDGTRQDSFDAADVEYLRAVLPILLRQDMGNHDPALVAELLTCAIYLGWSTLPGYRGAIDYLLDGQNPNGTWGNYEVARAAYGPYLDQQIYLHTTLVATGALMKVYEGWPPGPRGEVPGRRR